MLARHTLPLTWRWPAPVPPDILAHLTQAVGLLPATASVLYARGLRSAEEVRRFLGGPENRLCPVSALPQAEEAGRLLAEAVRERKRIAVFGDYDVDGITASALMSELIRGQGGDCQILLPDRHAEGYGLSLARLQKLAEHGLDLLVTVDCGITALAEVAWARAQGIRVIVTDHHEPGPLLPAADVVVDPKVSAPPELRGLAGVGVALFVARAAATALGLADHERLRPLLDLVALGTIADVAPLTNENRLLTRAGLAVINRAERPGLRALMEVAGLTPGGIGAQEVAFRLGPRINAAGRLGDARRALDLLLTRDEAHARDLAAELHEENSRRQVEEKKALEQALQQLGEYEKLPASIALSDPHWPLGVLGLVASRLCERFHRPSFVGTLHHGWVRASGRSIPGFPLHEVLADLSPCLERWGGHELAAGITLKAERFPAFVADLETIARQRMGAGIPNPELNLDGTLCIRSITPALVKELGRLEPYGFGNARPVWAVLGARVGLPPRVVGERHLKLKVQDEQGRALDVIGFGLGHRAPELNAGHRIDLAVHLAENVWNGQTSIQGELKDFRPCGPEGVGGA